MPPKREKKRGPKKAAEIAKKISFDKNESNSDNNAESNQMGADAPNLSESSSESEREEQSNQKKEDLSETESDASAEIEDEDQEEEQPKARQQTSRKAETDEEGPKGRRNNSKKTVMVKTRGKANQRLVKSDNDANSESDEEEEQSKTRPKRAAAKKQQTMNGETAKASGSKEPRGVGKKTATKKAVKIEKNVAESNKIDENAPNLSESSSESERKEQSNQKNEDLSGNESDATAESEEEEEQPKAAETDEELEKEVRKHVGKKTVIVKGKAKSNEESSGSEEEDEVDEEIEQPKERQQASRKAETGEDGPKGRRNVAKKPVMVKTKAKPNQHLVKSDNDANSESDEEEERSMTRPKRAAKKQEIKDGDKAEGSGPKKPKGVGKKTANKKAPARSQPQPVASTSGNKNVEGKSVRNKPTKTTSEQSSADDNEAHTVSNANMTVADVVRDASHRLIQLNKYASLVVLKKMLLSERDDYWVGRNYERMKAAIKQMFASTEIVPYNRSQSAKNHSVSIQFKFNSAYKKTSVAKKATATTVEAEKKTTKVVQAKKVMKKAVGGKTAKSAQSKTGRKNNEKFEELPEFDDNEDVPVKYR